MKKHRPERYILPCALIIAGAAFVIWGAVGGEAAAVLKKAINVCLECIGLG